MPTTDQLQAARPFIGRAARKLWIDGKWLPAQSEKTFDTIDPATEKAVCAVARGEAADIDRAVRAARKAFEAPSWSSISPHERSRHLLRIADLIESYTDELATIQSLDMGMLLADSKMLTAAMPALFRYYAGWPTKIFGRTHPTDGSVFSFSVREPLGVVGAIIPWNGPILATSWKIATALASGNTVVLKPAEQAPLVSLRVAEIIQEAGVPDGVVNVVPGFGEEAGVALVDHPDVNKLAFTGSTSTGKEILARAAKGLKRVSLELGGKSPNIIFPDADLDKAIALAVIGFAANAGQACVAGTRIFVHESIYSEVAERIARMASALRIGSPFDSATQLGPVVSKEQFARVSEYIKIGSAEGASVLTGGQRHGENGYFIQPTVFTSVKDGMRIAREEIFGPVAAMLPFKDEDDVIFRGNDTDYGLAAAVWTRDVSRAHKVARALKAGIVWVNTIYELDPVAPFGGYKQSGLGKELGWDSIEAYTQVKTIVLRF